MVAKSATPGWGVNVNCGAAAEYLQLDFLRCLIDVRKSTANHMFLAELGRFPLQDKTVWRSLAQERCVCADDYVYGVCVCV